MNDTLENIIIGVGGFIVGGLIGMFATKKVCQKRADEEIESIKSRFTVERRTIPPVETSSVHKKTEEEQKEALVAARTKKPIEYYTSRYAHAHPKKTEKPAEQKPVVDEEPEDKTDIVIDEVPQAPDPYDAIAPEPGLSELPVLLTDPMQFGRNPNYAVVYCTLYSDGVLAEDDTDLPVPNVQSVIGSANLEQFGIYDEEPESLYIRNDRLKTYYAVSRDVRRYQRLHEPKKVTTGE